MEDKNRKYEIAFDFTGERQGDLRAGVYTAEAGIRLIKAELGLEPRVQHGPGDVRYHTDDPAQMLELIKLAYTISAGGWIVIRPMPKGLSVFPLPLRGEKCDKV